MKRIISLLVSLVLSGVLITGCSGQKSSDVNQANTEVSNHETNAVEETTIQLTTEAPTTVQPTTQAITTKPETEPVVTEAPTTEPKDNTWKKLYINKINSLDKNNYKNFALINVDGDDIPELYIEAENTISNSYLCWIYDDEMYDLTVQAVHFSYAKGRNIFVNRTYFPPVCTERYMFIDGGSTTEIALGKIMNSGSATYTWNDNDVSEDEYNRQVNMIVPSSELIKPTVCTYTEVCNQINEY